ncbi:nonstructural protein [Blackfly microvirus SF02]|uniref:Nonstructural protein n=1 Tax=Blackfly microvirus SF02 TaxID=2576452 RepID=A0A4V1F5C9_9VIRU|nr:nonstructural protein [Blackfly microvirus SF02]
MKLLMCAVYDSKVSAYSPPIFFRTRGEAVRSFTDACGEEGSHLAKHGSDFRLWLLGHFDDNSGIVVAVSPLEPIIGADEVGPSMGEGDTPSVSLPQFSKRKA